MINAKDILVKLKGDNKNFKGAMTGANTSMKGFAATTVGSSAVAGGAFKALSVSVIASTAAMTMGISLVIGGVMGLVAAFAGGVSGAAKNAEVTATTTALLEKQGIAWDDISGKVLNHLDIIESSTGFDDTALQGSFNTFIASGMSVDEALQAVDATVGIAASGVMSLEGASKAVNKEFTTGTSRLKDYGIEADNFNGIITQVNATFGDGSQAGETLAGKMDILKQAFGDQLEILGERLMPVLLKTMDVLIWGATDVLPPLIRTFDLLTIPTKGAIMSLKQVYEAAQMAWAALTGDKEAAKAHWENIGKLQSDFIKESMDVVMNVSVTDDAGTTATEALTVATNASTDATNDLITTYKQSEAMRARKAGIDLGSLGIEGESRKSGEWTIRPATDKEMMRAPKDRPPIAPSSNRSGAP